jgi:hypothetical protein
MTVSYRCNNDLEINRSWIHSAGHIRSQAIYEAKCQLVGLVCSTVLSARPSSIGLRRWNIAMLRHYMHIRGARFKEYGA